jgi:hypothetical protein
MMEQWLKQLEEICRRRLNGECPQQ